MIDTDKLRNIKRSTIAIGLAEYGQFPSFILGTGFFVSSDALIMSAAHVFEECVTAQQYFNKTYDKKLGVVAALVYTTEKEVSAFSVRIGKVTKLTIKHYQLGYVGPMDFDIAVAQLEHEGSKPLAFIDLQPTKVNLYEEVGMCGYPQGDESFSILNNPTGLKLSPILQFGHISGLMPYDDARIPYGIQTDIVGTGGSSGSPIVNMSGGLIGIAQRVLSAEVSKYTSSLQLDSEQRTFARIGITYGLFNHYFPEMLRSARDSIEKGVKPELNFEYSGLPNMEVRVV